MNKMTIYDRRFCGPKFYYNAARHNIVVFQAL